MKKQNRKRHERPFSVFRFAITIIITLALYALAVKLFAPEVWDASLVAPWWKWIGVLSITHCFCGFVEHPFHRYILHAPFPFLKRLNRQHELHHKLTQVKLVAVKGEYGQVFNRFPIIEEHQHEASYFPFWALAAFLAASTLVVVPLQKLLPSWPVALSVAIAIALSLSLYEIVHMIEHLPFDTFWRPKVFHHRWGKLWTRFYCAHPRHHCDNKLNESISGVLGLPLPDIVLGTYAPSFQVFIHGEVVSRDEFEVRSPRPSLLIRVLDRLLLKT